MSIFGIFRSWKQSEFLRNVVKVSSGRLTAMAIAVLATPIVSRLFAPEDYGVAAVVIAAIGISASFLPLSYERAVIFPKENSKASQVLVASLLVSVVTTLTLYAVLGLCSLIWPDMALRSGMGPFFWVFPAGAFLLAMRSTATAVCIRGEYFSSIAKADVTEAAVNSLSRIVWGMFLISSAAGLLFGYLLGVAVGASICGIQAYRWLAKTDVSITLSNLRDVLLEFKDYPIFRAPAKFAFSTAQRLPVIALGIMFPIELVGFYAMANRAAALPLRAASKAVRDVLLQKIMGFRQTEQPMGKSLIKVAVALGLTGAPIFLVLFFFGEDLFSWLLGDRWSAAGRVVEILSPYLFVVWLGSFTATVFETLRLNKVRLKIHVGNLVIRICVFVGCGIAQYDFERTLWVLVATSCAYQFVIYAFAANAAAKHDAALANTTAFDRTPGQ